MAIDPLMILATFAGIIILGFLGYLLFERTRVSDVLILIAFGVLIGPVLKVFDVEAFKSASALIGTLALIFIMFDGGLGLHLRDLVHGLARATVLALVGFALTLGAVAAVAHYWLGLDWTTSALLGAILGGSSGIIIMPIISRTTASNGTRVLLSVESALTDVICVIGAVTLMAILTQPGASQAEQATGAFRGIAAQFSIAVVLGLIAGFLWLRILRWMQQRRYSSMLTLAAILILFVGAQLAGGNGAIAILIFGIVLGNGVDIVRRLGIEGQAFTDRQKQFQGEITFLVRVFFFVYLGVILDPAILIQPAFLIAGGLLTLAIVGARLIATSVSLWGDQATKGDRTLVSLMLPRGLAAAVLAGLPAAAGIPATESFVAYAFIIIAITNVICTAAVVSYERAKAKAPAVVAATADDVADAKA